MFTSMHGGGEKYNMFAGIFHYFRGGGGGGGGGEQSGNRDVYLSPLTKATSHHEVFQRGSISSAEWAKTDWT